MLVHTLTLTRIELYNAATYINTNKNSTDYDGSTCMYFFVTMLPSLRVRYKLSVVQLPQDYHSVANLVEVEFLEVSELRAASAVKPC